MKAEFNNSLSKNLFNALCILVFLLCVNQDVFGQNNNNNNNFKDSLKTKRLINYLQWSYNYGAKKEFDSVKKYTHRALKLAKEIDNIELSALVFHTNAEMLFMQNNTKEAHFFLDKNLKSISISDSAKVKSHLLKSELLAHDQLQKQALEQAILAQRILVSHGILTKKDSLGFRDVNVLMAKIQKNANNNKQALFHFDEALKYCKDDGLRTFYKFQKAETLQSQKNIPQSIKLVKEALKTAQEKELKVYIPTYYLALSDYYLQLEKPNTALYFSTEGLINNLDCHIDGLNYNSGLSYLELNNYTSAITYFEEALNAPVSEIPRAIIHKNLSEAYRLDGNYDKALEHANTYAHLQDSISKVKSKQAIFAISEKYQSEKKSLEIDMLQVKNESSKEVISKQKWVLILISICFLLTLLLSGLILKFYLKQKKQRELLFDKNLQLVHKLKHAEMKNKLNKSDKANKKSIVAIDDGKKSSILKTVEFKIKEKFYLNKSTTLISFANDINTNTTYLSKVINEKFDKPFTHFVNDLRIQYMLQKIESDKEYRTFTIEYISDDIGFSSSSAFYTAFKKNTGLTPSYYIKKRLKVKE